MTQRLLRIGAIGAFSLVLLISCILAAQDADKQDIWRSLSFFIGTWEGRGEGQPGVATVTREYKFVLGNRFLQAHSKSVYDPQEANPKGEVHEDFGLFSYDTLRKRFVLRQFHVEGFVNQYVAEGFTADSKRFVFETEAIENVPSGWRARETYEIVGEDEFTETFELAAPGAEFEVYSRNYLKRSK